jgi:hypothetical protein
LQPTTSSTEPLWIRQVIYSPPESQRSRSWHPDSVPTRPSLGVPASTPSGHCPPQIGQAALQRWPSHDHRPGFAQGY